MQKANASPEAKHKAYHKKLESYFVFCTVTGEKIRLSELKYWNVDRQEPYRDAGIALEKYTPTTSGT